jgi:hypothetical protein
VQNRKVYRQHVQYHDAIRDRKLENSTELSKTSNNKTNSDDTVET